MMLAANQIPEFGDPDEETIRRSPVALPTCSAAGPRALLAERLKS
jgi:hypothetical protein